MFERRSFMSLVSHRCPRWMHVLRVTARSMLLVASVAACSSGSNTEVQPKMSEEEREFERCKSEKFKLYAGSGDSYANAERRAALTCIGERGRAVSVSNPAEAGKAADVPAAQAPSRPSSPPAKVQARQGRGADSSDNSACAANMKELEFLEDAYGETKVLSRKPLRVQVISTKAVEGDLDAVIREETKRAAVSLAFQTFAFSDEAQVTVESVPMRVGKGFKPIGLMESHRITLSVTRERARSVMSSLLRVNSFGDLFPPFEPGSDLCLPADKMTGAIYNDQGPPTLDRTLAALKASR